MVISVMQEVPKTNEKSNKKRRIEHGNSYGPDVPRSTGQHRPQNRLLAGGICGPVLCFERRRCCQTVILVERVDAAKRELDSASRGRKTTPPAEVSTAYQDFNENGVLCDMLALYLDFQVRQRFHKLLVEHANTAPAFVVFAPRLIIVPCSLAKGTENTFKVMLVFKSNVLFNN
jgi:hypothetical protein